MSSAEKLVLDLVAGTNRPYNVQLVADMLATKGVKKPAAEKALEALAEQGKLLRKEFGKTKIFIPSQEGLAALTPEQSVAQQQRIKELGEQCRAEDDAVAGLKREVASANSSLSVEQIRAKIGDLESAQAASNKKLAALRGDGARLVSAADVAKAEKACHTMVDAWGRHRRQFRSVWDAVSDGIEGKEEAVFEEMGVDSDKAVGADLEGAKALVQPAKKLKR